MDLKGQMENIQPRGGVGNHGDGPGSDSNHGDGRGGGGGGNHGDGGGDSSYGNASRIDSTHDSSQGDVGGLYCDGDAILSPLIPKTWPTVSGPSPVHPEIPEHYTPDSLL